MVIVVVVSFAFVKGNLLNIYIYNTYTYMSLLFLIYCYLNSTYTSMYILSR